MGTGKTTAAIAWLRAKYNMYKDVTPTLIVSPVATLYNWVNEFKINSPIRVVESCVVPYMKSKKSKFTGVERAKIIAETDKRIIIINPESLDADEVIDALHKFRPRNVIVDEAHRFKSPKMITGSGTKRNRSRLARLTEISDFSDNRMILTGTPILNSYLDLWAQFRVLDMGETFGMNFYTFREKYFRDENIGWRGQPKYFPHYVPKLGIEDEISALIARKCSRLRKDDCLDLPPLVYETYSVELGSAQARAYYQMEKEMVAELQAGTCAAVNALSRVARMLQILSGHLPVENDEDTKTIVHFDENPRLKALTELLTELTPNHKVIVWSGFKANYKTIRDVFKELKLEWAEVVGGTKDRQAEIDRFNTDPKCRVCLSNPQAGGVGIGLQAASYAIYFSRSYSLGDRLQSESRNHRGGSEIHDRITIIDLVARGTLDDDVLNALLRKEKFSDNILDRLQARC
jgi:SNF2 family DNA or RNA helicase